MSGRCSVGDARTAVAHGDADAVAGRLGRQRDRPASGRVAQRVGGEVLQRLLESVGIARHLTPQPGSTRLTSRDATLLQFALVPRGDAVEQRGEVDALAAQRDAAAFEAREIEQVADDLLEPMRLVGDDAHVALLAWPRRAAAPPSLSVSM